MPTFNNQNVADALELQQLVTNWCEELDFNSGRNTTRFFSDDCVVEVGGISYRGHAAMNAFYVGIAEGGAAAHGGLGRTCRHVSMNLGIVFNAADRATVRFTSVMFSGPGQPPVNDATTPTFVTDVRFECERDANQDWLVAEFYGSPVFVGADPFVNRLIVET